MHHSYSEEDWKSQPEQLGKEKSNQIGKEEVKLSIFADDKTLKAPPDTIRNNKYNKVEGYKPNIQKPATFLYTTKELTEKLRKQSHLQSQQK